MARHQVRGRRALGDSSGVRWRPSDQGKRPPVLGVDIGGVIVDRVAENSDTSFFGDRPLETPAVEGVIEALADLACKSFHGKVFLISKARTHMAATTREWLEHIEFYSRTEIPREHVHFIESRREKAPMCERPAITHFVDDRVDVLNFLTTVHHRYLFTGGLGEHEPPKHPPRDIKVVATWATLRETIVSSL